MWLEHLETLIFYIKNGKMILGPVAKEHREDLWLRFQKASKVIQTKRQEYQKR